MSAQREMNQAKGNLLQQLLKRLAAVALSQQNLDRRFLLHRERFQGRVVGQNLG